MPVGAYFNAKSNSDAAEAAAAELRRSTEESKRQFDIQVAKFEPFYKTGTNALGDYQKMLNGGYNMQESPAAQYQLTQGTKAMNRALASRGLSGSGNAVNRLTELNSGIAATDWNNQYNRLLDAIKIGTGAASSAGQAGQSYVNSLQNAANNLGNIYTNSANNLNSIYSNLQNSGMNMMALGTKNNWWQSNNNSSPGYQGGGGDYGSLNNVASGDYSMMSY